MFRATYRIYSKSNIHSSDRNIWLWSHMFSAGQVQCSLFFFRALAENICLLMRAGRANQISSCKPKTINLKKIKYSEELRGTAKSGGDSLSFLTPLKTYCLCPETLSLCLVVALILNDFYFTCFKFTWTKTSIWDTKFVLLSHEDRSVHITHCYLTSSSHKEDWLVQL